MAPANRAAFDQRRHCVRDIGVMDDTLLRLPCPSSGLPPLFYPYSCRVLFYNFYFLYTLFYEKPQPLWGSDDPDH